MLFVCFSHVYQRTVPGATATVLLGVFYSVHMAMFMFVGGYFVKRCDKILDLLKYFLKMLLYYVVPAVIFTVLTVISMERYSNKSVLEWLIEFVVRTDTFYWYAVAAFVINGFLAIGYFVARKLAKRDGFVGEVIKNLLTLAALAVLLLPFIFLFKSEHYGFLSANLIIEFAPLAVLGFLFKSFGEYIPETKITKLIELLLSAVCLALYIIALVSFKGWLDKATTARLLLHQLGSIAGVYVYYVLAKWLTKVRAVREMSVYGKYSYQLYLVHVYLIRVITPYVSKIAEVNFYSASFVIIYALVFTFGSLVISIALTKNRYLNLVLFGDYRAFCKQKSTKFTA